MLSIALTYYAQRPRTCFDFERKNAVWAILAVSLSTTLIGVIFGLPGKTGELNIYTGMALCVGYAVWLALMSSIWATELAVASRSAIAKIVFFGYLISLAPSTIDGFVNGFLSWWVVLMPLFSTTLWAIGSKTLRKTTSPPLRKHQSAPRIQNKIDSLQLSIDFHPYPIFFSFFILIGGVIRGLLNNGAFINTASINVNLVTHAISIALAAALLFIVSRSRTINSGFHRSWLFLFAFLLAGLLLMAFSSIKMIDFIPLGRSLLIAGNTCLNVLFWVLLVSIPSEYENYGWMSGLYIVVGALSSLNSYLFVPAFTQYLNISPQDQLFVCFLIIAFVLTMLSLVFLHYTFQNSQKSKPDNRLALCEALSIRYGLTKREAEITVLITQGNSFDAAARQLNLAPSTVRSYSKTIYRKLGVHKKQDIVNLINALTSENIPDAAALS